jgi:hypothetical protein
VSAFPQNLLSSLRSVCHFFDTRDAGTFHVIVPDDMAPYSESVLGLLSCAASGVGGAARAPVAVRVWPESRLVPAFTPRAPYRGTLRQMTLKLAAALIVETPFFVVLDSDVYARRAFNASHLLERRAAGAAARARTGLDDPAFPQRPSWHAEAGRLLRTDLVRDTYRFCADEAAARGPGVLLQQRERPFALTQGGRAYGACRDGRGLATHVTPMVLSRELLLRVVMPRLAAVAGGAQDSAAWLRALLGFHERRERGCLFSAAAGRFYSWTEYAVYFVAATAAGALDDFHSFSGGGITSLRHSMMLPAHFDEADWDAVFEDDTDPLPFFVVHSWFNRPLAVVNAALAKHVPAMRDTAAWLLPAAPSSRPLYDDRRALAPFSSRQGLSA